MNEINMQKYEECNFRKKRTEEEYYKSNLRKENKILSSYNNNIFMDNENININQFKIKNNSEKNKYPDYQSFLQIYPKENAEIPSIKYFNYIFNIGSPFN